MEAYQVVQMGKPLESRKVAKPSPVGHEILVKTSVSGVCHTDVHAAAGDLGEVKVPRTVGHEGIGVIEAVGPEVKSMKVGDRVGVAWLNRSCMKCYLCLGGRTNLCESQKQSGFTYDGTFAEYFVGDERFAAKIPDSIKDAEAAPILCAGVTSYRALRVAGVRSGDRVVISGACGGLGHLAIQYAKVMGCEVVALDMMDAAKTEMMKRLGADFIVKIEKGDDSKSLAKKLAALQPSKPVQAAIILAPVVQAVSDAVEYVSPGGCITAVALPAGSFKIDVAKFILKELRLHGSIVGTPEDLRESFRLAAEGKVHAEIVEKPFTAINEILSDLKEGKAKGGRTVVRVASK